MNVEFRMQNVELKKYGSELFNPEQIMRFEKYVDSKYPEFHFRKRRKYAKAVLKETNKQLIIKHIYPGVKIWDSSPTLVKRLVRWVKNSAVRLNVSIRELKHKKLFRKFRQKLNLRKDTHQPLAVIIGVMDLHGGKRSIKGTAAKVFHLMNRLLNILGLSLRLNPSGFAVRILRVKPELQHKEGICEICGNKLGHWYLEFPEIFKQVPIHIMCNYPTDKEGVLL